MYVCAVAFVIRREGFKEVDSVLIGCRRPAQHDLRGGERTGADNQRASAVAVHKDVG